MNDTDHWGGCTEFSADVRCTVAPYMRNKSSDFGSGRDLILIEEPCNYVSNIAYFHSATRICDYPDWSVSSDEVKAQKRSFAALGLGSAFWHGSHTFAGSAFDNQMISVIAYLAYQSTVKSLPSSQPFSKSSQRAQELILALKYQNSLSTCLLMSQ